MVGPRNSFPKTSGEATSTARDDDNRDNKVFDNRGGDSRIYCVTGFAYRMVESKYLALAFLITGFLAEDAYAKSYEGTWSCMTTKSFTYQSGEIEPYQHKKFSLKIDGDTVSFIGIDINPKIDLLVGLEPLVMTENPYSFTASNKNYFFKFNGKQFALVSVFNMDFSETMSKEELHRFEEGYPMIYNSIGKCDKFN